MALVKWSNPMDVLQGFSNVDNFFGRDISDFLGDSKGTVPSVNIKENKEDFFLEVAAPGMAKENFDIKLENNVLTISAKKEDKKEDENDRYNRREFNYVSFERTFYLPDVTDTEHIEAHYKDGILMITVPKKEEAKQKEVKRISIL